MNEWIHVVVVVPMPPHASPIFIECKPKNENGGGPVNEWKHVVVVVEVKRHDGNPQISVTSPKQEAVI